MPNLQGNRENRPLCELGPSSGDPFRGVVPGVGRHSARLLSVRHTPVDLVRCASTD